MSEPWWTAIFGASCTQDVTIHYNLLCHILSTDFRISYTVQNLSSPIYFANILLVLSFFARRKLFLKVIFKNISFYRQLLGFIQMTVKMFHSGCKLFNCYLILFFLLSKEKYIPMKYNLIIQNSKLLQRKTKVILYSARICTAATV